MDWGALLQVVLLGEEWGQGLLRVRVAGGEGGGAVGSIWDCGSVHRVIQTKCGLNLPGVDSQGLAVSRQGWLMVGGVVTVGREERLVVRGAEESFCGVGVG